MRIALIGAGASGIAAGVNLLRAGYEDFVIFEKAADIGGTWRDNTYPGVACDVPSHLYRFSFAPKADWSREYASGDEIQGYMRKVAEDFGVMPHVRLGRQGEQGVLHRGGVVLRDNIRDIEDEEVFLGVSIGKQRHAHRLR